MGQEIFREKFTGIISCPLIPIWNYYCKVHIQLLTLHSSLYLLFLLITHLIYVTDAEKSRDYFLTEYFSRKAS